jgi:hypothetical protein
MGERTMQGDATRPWSAAFVAFTSTALPSGHALGRLSSPPHRRGRYDGMNPALGLLTAAFVGSLCWLAFAVLLWSIGPF